MVLRAAGASTPIAQQGVVPTEKQLRRQLDDVNAGIAQLTRGIGNGMNSADLARTQVELMAMGEKRERLTKQMGALGLPILQGNAAATARSRVQDLDSQITALNNSLNGSSTSAEMARVQAEVGILAGQKALLTQRLEPAAAPAKLPVRATPAEIPALEARLKGIASEMGRLMRQVNGSTNSADLLKINQRLDVLGAEMDKVGAKLKVARGAGTASGTDQLQLNTQAPAKPGEEAALKRRLGELASEMARLGNALNGNMNSADLAKINGRLTQLGVQVDQVTDRLKAIQGQSVDPLTTGVEPFGSGYEPDARPLGNKSTGPRVEAVQKFLAEGGYSTGAVDGKFGPATTKGVKDFQSAMGLKADGVAGPNTLRAMAILDAVKTAKAAAENGSSSEKVAAFQALGEAQAALAKLPSAERGKLRAELQGAERALGPVVDPDVLADGIGEALDQAPDASREVVEVAKADSSGFWAWLTGANSGKVVEMVNGGQITTEAGRAAARARLADDWHYSASEAQAYGKLLADSVKDGALSPEQMVSELAKYRSGTKGDDVVRSLVAELDYKAVKALPKEVKMQLLDALPPRLSYADVTAGAYNPELNANQRTREILEAALRGDSTPPNQWAATWDRADFHLLA